ncbi:MAG: hypothetical protein PHY59_07505 [Methanobacterium sp.]|nr:hypothetical protein [Methanobacterium sp.]
MYIFYFASAIILLLLVPLLIYSSTKLMKNSRTSTYITAVLCFVAGLVALYRYNIK